jgi:hypothetical protein
MSSAEIDTTTTSSAARPATKRKTTDSVAEQSAAKRTVPQIVKVDMGDSSDDANNNAEETKTVVLGSAATTSSSVTKIPATIRGGERLPTKVDWQLLCDRNLLKRLLQGPSKLPANGTLYLKFDQGAYQAAGGAPANLGEYSHLRIETPYMSNLFGLSSRNTKGKWKHSLVLDVCDSQGDKLVPRFAQFLAMCDDVCLDICVQQYATSSIFAKDAAQSIRFASTSGKLDMKELTNMVAPFFNGALRIAKKTREDETISEGDKKVEMVDENKYRIPTQFFFNTKIWSKKDNEKLPDIVTYNQDNQIVHWSSETAAFKMKDKDGEEIKPVLSHPRATYVKAQIELNAIYWVQKEFHCSWATDKIKYKNRTHVEKTTSENSHVADFDDQEAPVYATAADIERVQREEENAVVATNNAEDDE